MNQKTLKYLVSIINRILRNEIIITGLSTDSYLSETPESKEINNTVSISFKEVIRGG